MKTFSWSVQLYELFENGEVKIKVKVKEGPVWDQERLSFWNNYTRDLSYFFMDKALLELWAKSLTMSIKF